ncbi:MAG: hypothetical protein AMXMBFR47_19250 [Planctomycetota bacterium]
MATIPSHGGAAAPDSGGPPVTTASAPRVWIRFVGAMLALVACWLSNELLTYSSNAAAASPLLTAFCGGAADGAPNDCQSVLASKYAKIAGNLPVAAVGVAYFGMLAIWFALVGPVNRGRWYWYLPLLAIMLTGAVESARFVYIMAVILDRWCVFCATVHAINAGLLILTLLSWPAPARPQATAWPYHSTAIASLLAMGSFGLASIMSSVNTIAGSMLAQYKSEYSKIIENPAFGRWHHSQQPLIAEPLDADAPFDGPADAPNTLVVFGDLQCTACRTAHGVIEKAMQRHPGRLKVIYRHYPLDRACNPNSPNTRHVVGCKAARIVEAALAAGGAEKVSQLRRRMYADQAALEDRSEAEWAELVSVDRAKFEAALGATEIDARIKRDIELAVRIGVKVTPALFLNGRRLDYWSADATWDGLLGDPTSKPASAPASPRLETP